MAKGNGTFNIRSEQSAIYQETTTVHAP